jgi:heme exporter protein B
MIRLLGQIGAIMAKDFQIEARGRQTIGLVIVTGLLILVVLGLGLGPQQAASGTAAPAVLWVAYLFGGVLCFEKTMAVERNDGALAALMMAPIDRSAIFAAKCLGNLALMVALALVITPVAIVLFGFNLNADPAQFVLIMGLSFIGFAAVGTLFAAIVSSTRLQGGLLAIVIFPICLPLVIASTQLMLRLGDPQAAANGSGIAVLVAFDVIYLIVSWLVFELVLEP